MAAQYSTAFLRAAIHFGVRARGIAILSRMTSFPSPDSPREDAAPETTSNATPNTTPVETPIETPSTSTVAPATVSVDNWRAGLDASPNAAQSTVEIDRTPVAQTDSNVSPAPTETGISATPQPVTSTVEFDRTPSAPQTPAEPIGRAPLSAPPTPQPAPHAPLLAQPIAKSEHVPTQNVRTETVRVASLSPIAAMLGGGVLACACVALGALLGGRGKTAIDDPVIAGTGGVSAQSGNAIVRAVQGVGPSVMNVDTEFSKPGGTAEFLPDPSLGTQPQRGKGTGVVFDTKRGLMLTNAHVVAGAKTIQVTTRDGQQYPGKILGVDRLSDIAVVVLSNKTLPQAKLAPIKDTAKDLAIGEWAIAIGNPFAQANTVTVGVVSAVGRAIPVPGGRDGGGFQLTDMIQTDAAINPGNSGGPLCNIKGEVIGINTAIIPFGTGLGFTIPINKAMNVADQLIKTGKVQHSYIGIEMIPISPGVQKDFGLPDRDGTLVKKVAPGSPAAKAGIKSGDVIRRVENKVVRDSAEVQRIVIQKKIGDTLSFEILRNNAVKRTLKVKIGNRPE